MATTDRNDWNVTIRNKDLIKKCIEFCNANKMKNKDLVESALVLFFENRRNQLKAMDKEQLIDVIMSLEKE